MSTPSEAQNQAIHARGDLLITACPGSGKTFVLRKRAAFLLANNPSAFLCGVTFTSESAAELETRIRGEYPSSGNRVLCGTFHALCKRQLEKANYKFKLINDGQQLELMIRAYTDVFGKDSMLPRESVFQFIERVKTAVDPMLPSRHMEPMVEAYERYQELLRQMGAFDFNDLMVEAVKGMKSGAVKPMKVQFMLVDEFQDTDEVQFAWLMEHHRCGTEITVVGDDDQSIYSFRNALAYSGMERFKQRTNATHIALNLTFRCPREVMEPSARLITHNIERVEKTLQTNSRVQGHVKLLRFESFQREITDVMREVRLSGTPGSWGILARTNQQLDQIEQDFLAENIPYVRPSGSFWELKAPTLFLGVCQSLANGSMIGIDNLLRRIGLGEDQIGRLHQKIQSDQPGALNRFINGKHGDPRKHKLAELADRIKSWKKLFSSGEDSLALNGISRYIKSRASLSDRKMSALEIESHHRNLDHCALALSRLSGGLGQRLLTAQQKSKSTEGSDECVKLMTLHASKGLEFENVWVVGCMNGTLPSSKGLLEEERRLCYVGMTRSKRRLFMSYVVSEKVAPSEFLRESGML